LIGIWENALRCGVEDGIVGWSRVVDVEGVNESKEGVTVVTFKFWNWLKLPIAKSARQQEKHTADLQLVLRCSFYEVSSWRKVLFQRN
jgi:hypothetical protein